MSQNIKLHVDSDRKMAVEDVISLLKLLRNDLEVEVVTKSNRPAKRLSAGAVLLNEVAQAQPSRPDEELEELNENTCKYMEGNPDEKNSSFCGRKNVEKFSYCPLHLMIVFQPKGKKEEVVDKEDEVPKFIEKKVKSA